MPVDRSHLIDPSRIEGVNAHETSFLYDEIFTRSSYLPDGMSLPSDAVVFDVGANIGVFALFAHAVCPDATVYAFEPLPPVFEKLRHNTSVYGVPAHLFPYALGDAEGEVDFTFYPGYTTMSATSSHAATEADREFIKRQVSDAAREDLGDAAELLDEMLEYRFREVPYVCRTRRLSDVIAEQGVTRIDLLKVDVQRAEADVLRGLDEAHWPLVRRIALEVHDEPGTPTEGRLALLSDELRRRGFEVPPPAGDGLVESGRHSVFATRPGSSAA
ncbi:FkbM family methyltransferase [Streptomyces sp. NPDC047117]|uniref:FkbM family methyltransferase n=1 Tax=Streptomyces sp. NPDC047117 TaxID=3155379 RepID=UPI0033EEF7F6